MTLDQIRNRRRVQRICAVGGILLIAAFLLTSRIAFANGLTDITNKAGNLLAKIIITLICGWIPSALGMVVSSTLQIITMPLDQIISYLPGFDSARLTFMGVGYRNGQLAVWDNNGSWEPILSFALVLALTLTLANLIHYLIALATEDRIPSIESVVKNTLFFLIATLAGRSIMLFVFNSVNGAITSAAVDQTGNITTWFSNSIPVDANTESAANLGSTILSILMYLAMAIEVLNLLTSTLIHYMVCLLLMLFAPIALACGVNDQLRQIANSWWKMFCSHCIIYVIDFVCIMITGTFFNSGWTVETVVSCVLTYAAVKAMSHTEAILNNSGLLSVRTGADFFHDAAMATKAAAAIIGTEAAIAGSTVGFGSGVVRGVHGVTGTNGEKYTPINSRTGFKTLDAAVNGASGGFGAGRGAGEKVGNFIAGRGVIGTGIANQTDESRVKMAEKGKNAVNFQSGNQQKAIKRTLANAGFENASDKNSSLSSLAVNPNGSISGVLNTRNADGTTTSRGFTISNDGHNGASVTSGFVSKSSADGHSGTVYDPDTGTYSLSQSVDKNGRQVWTATHTMDKDGNPIPQSESGINQSAIFVPSAKGNEPDDDFTRAANAFTSGGGLQAITEKENALQSAQADVSASADARMVARGEDGISATNYNDAAHLEAMGSQLANDPNAGSVYEAMRNSGKVESLHENADGTLSGEVVQRDAEGAVVGRQSFTTAGSQSASAEIPAQPSVQPSVTVGSSMKVAPDGQSATIHTENGDFAISKTDSVDSHGSPIYEARQISTADGTPVERQTDFARSSVTTFAVRPNAKSSDGEMANAAAAFTSSGAEARLSESTTQAVESYAQMQEELPAAQNFVSMSDMGRSVNVSQQPVDLNSPATQEALLQTYQSSDDSDVRDMVAYGIRREDIKSTVDNDGSISSVVYASDAPEGGFHVLETRTSNGKPEVTNEMRYTPKTEMSGSFKSDSLDEQQISCSYDEHTGKTSIRVSDSEDIMFAVTTVNGKVTGKDVANVIKSCSDPGQIGPDLEKAFSKRSSPGKERKTYDGSSNFQRPTGLNGEKYNS